MSRSVEAQRPLPREVALQLAAALAVGVAEREGCRLLVIKGQASDSHGVRLARMSSDVDVLLPPPDHERLILALGQSGWKPRAADPDEDAFPRHSVSLYNPDWPVDIDVHFRIPGIERDAAVAFEVLWATRAEITIAAYAVPIPDRAASIVISALHSLRSLWVVRHRDELRQLIAATGEDDRDAVIRMATELDALAALRPFLEARFALDVTWAEPSYRWRLQTTIQEPMARRIILWSQARPRVRARMLRLALFPPVDALVKEQSLTSLSKPLLIAAYVRRWRRGLTQLPAAVQALAHSRHTRRRGTRRN